MNTYLSSRGDGRRTGFTPYPPRASREVDWSARHRDGDADPAHTSKTILVPLTLSPSAENRAALAVAKRLANESGARLVVLHAVQLNIAGEERGIQRTRLLRELSLEAESKLRELTRSLTSQLSVEILVTVGNPAEGIIATANRVRAEIIVMASHGLSGWRKWWHRNTATRVIRKVPCSVMLVLPAERGGIVAPIPREATEIYRLPARIACFEGHTPSRSLAQYLLL